MYLFRTFSPLLSKVTKDIFYTDTDFYMNLLINKKLHTKEVYNLFIVHK